MKNFALSESGIGVFLFGLVLLISFGFSLPPVSAQQLSRTPSHVEGEVLVRFRDDVHDYNKVLAHSMIGAARRKVFEHIKGLEHVKLPPGLSIKDAIKSYRMNPDVLYVEPNYIVRALVMPNDPQFSQLWGLHNTGQSGGVFDADIDAPEAWNITTGSSNVVVAIIDSGIDYNHQDLAANMFRNTADCNSNGTDDDGNGFADDCFGIDTANDDSDPMDDVDHGSHVAGTIGAVGNNNIGVVGVNWNVRLMACKFLNSTGSGSTSDAIDCLNYVATMKDRGINIVATNNSWGGGGFSQALLDAIQAHLDRGILFIAAAGNDSTDNDLLPTYPCNYYLSNIICVAATTRTDALASFSNWGRRTVHLGAPGHQILSTTPGNTYSTFSGTSMATPHVTGVAALLKAQNPNLQWPAVRNLILAGGDNDPSLSSTVTGKRLNANGALTCSNSVVTRRLKPVQNIVSATVGTPIDLAVLNINCGNPNGNLVVTVNPGGQTLTVFDNGSGTDQVSGDGIYSGQWIPPGRGTFTLSFPDGDVTVEVLANYTFASTSFNYRTITGTNLNLSDDQVAQITLPFPLRFGGGSFTNLWVNDNGTISFTGSFPANSWDNTTIPNSMVSTLVAPFWDDLAAVPGSPQNVWWGITGTAPNRELVIEWRDIPNWNCASTAAVKFQVVFFESTTDILFNYADTIFGGGCVTWDGMIPDGAASATVGVQVSENLGTQFSFNSASLNNNTALLWTLQSPVTLTVTPLSGSGSSQTFNVVASDADGFGDLASVQLLINSTLSTAGACYAYYSPGNNAVYLLNDSGSAWTGPSVLGSGATLNNSRCGVSVGSSSASGSGNNLTVNLALTFASGFAGNKNIYAFAHNNEGLSTNWQQKGTWTVPGGTVNQAPSVLSVTPSSGSGSSQTLSVVVSDANGFGDLASVQVLINSTLSTAGACYVYYSPGNNAVYLLNDSGSAWIGPSVLGSGAALNNSRCGVNVGSSSASGSGKNLTVNLALTFAAPAFSGAKNIYTFAHDNGNLSTGWEQKGSWTVPGGSVNQAPAVVSITPSSGSGSSQTFSVVVSDANGFGDLASVQVLINSTLNTAGACYVYYSPGNNAVYLLNDSGSAWIGPSVLGGGAALNNSRCGVNAGSSSALGSGNNLTLNLALTFAAPTFSGAKNIYTFAHDNGNLSTGWEQKGSWMVN